MKNLNLYIGCVLLLVISMESLYAQKYTDAQIGFNRSTQETLFLNDGVSLDEVKKKLDRHRRLLEELYHLGLQDIGPPNQALTPCGNVGFQEGFSEWQYFVGSRNSSNFSEPLSEIPNSTGSVIFETATTTNNTIPVGITPLELGLYDFGPNFIRLGRNNTGRVIDRITKTITISEATRLFTYKYAAILEDPGHSTVEQPYFSIHLETEDGTRIPCSEFTAIVPGSDSAEDGLPGFINLSESDVLYRPVAANSIDLKGESYGLVDGQIVTIVVEVADCSQGGHYGMAFFEGTCGSLDNAIQINNADDGFCLDTLLTFSSLQESFGLPSWNIYTAGSTLEHSVTANELNYIFDQPGDYTIELIIEANGNAADCEISFTRQITIEECDCECTDCDSFSPDPGEKYVLSAWVHEDHPEQQLSFKDSYIRVVFLNELNQQIPFIINNTTFRPSGDIIDGWQRILGEFTIPAVSKRISFKLINDNAAVNTYFDDIRVHPFNGNMKSFVYDQQTQRLMAELDENNYATFYEYDKEGGLVRVKKETEKGIYTIQETRSGNSISQN